MATPYRYAQEFAKANEKIDEANKKIKVINQEIQETDQKIRETNQEIGAILNSDEYKAVAKHFAWGKPIPGTSEEDKALWCYFQFQLDLLNDIKQFLHQTKEKPKEEIKWLDKQIERLDKQNAAAFKKIHRHYKHEAAVKCELEILTAVAHFLRERYTFQQLGQQVTFGDVMTAVGFHNESDIRKYFESSKIKSTGTETVPMQEVLESKIFKSSAKTVKEVFKKMGFDNVDIKDADSDSASDKDSPEKQEHC